MLTSDATSRITPEVCTSTATERVSAAISAHLSGSERFVLAVSGGVDSMVLLHAATGGGRHARDGRIAVATFDHGTGAHARDAVAHVQRWARAWGLPVHAQRMLGERRGEAAWREARWRFLRAVARAHDATVVTAHTQDDHLETVVMRILRGSGARGLSAMRAPSPVARPFLHLTRADLLAYAEQHGLAWVDDPSNLDRAFFRNRVRHDVLPALLRQRPSLRDELLGLAKRAAALRAECADVVRPLVVEARAGRVLARGVTTPEWPMSARALLWQSLAERGGIALDRRGTHRLAQFSAEGRRGGRIQLAGGFEAVHRGDTIELRQPPMRSAERSARLTTQSATSFGPWRFTPVDEQLTPGRGSGVEPDGDPWRAWLPVDGDVEVRAWRDGDRMISSGGSPRRVKRFFADERIPAIDREGWPVIVLDGEIVWIPGVRRGPAATARPGRPRVCIVCERLRG
jgi:tRNA(Ile)-lysidine synthase